MTREFTFACRYNLQAFLLEKRLMPSLLSNRRYLLLLDVLLLILLMGYITLGTQDVPFHGDESTTIWMTRDFDTAVLKGDFDAIAYQAPPRRTTEQHMRIITSNVSKLVMGATWSSIGLTADDINDQWVWGLDMQWNQDNGHMPSNQLLYISRLTSAWMTAFSVVFVLLIGRILGSSILSNPFAIRMSGWGAGVFYAIHPAILVNGRRAMFEGSLLLGLTLIVWETLILIKRPRPPYSYLLYGLITGLVLSTKHNAAFTVVLLYAGLCTTAVWRVFKTRQLSQFRSNIIGIACATCIGLIIFLALNPIWWSQPLKMPKIIIEERQAILDIQVDLFGGYEHFSERIEGLGREIFRASPQYFEADYWKDYDGVSEEIDAYESNYLAGWSDDIVIFAARLLFAMFGISAIFRIARHGNAQSQHMMLIFVIWCLGILAITLWTVPLDWQRYYLQIQPPLTILMGLGVGMFVDLWLRDRSTYVSV